MFAAGTPEVRFHQTITVKNGGNNEQSYGASYSGGHTGKM